MRWFKNSSLVLKVLTKPALYCLMLRARPASNSCRAASLASWMTAFSVAPAMTYTLSLLGYKDYEKERKMYAIGEPVTELGEAAKQLYL